MKKKFTLVELLAVILIIAILVSIAIGGMGVINRYLSKMTCNNKLKDLGQFSIQISASPEFNGDFMGPNVDGGWDWKISRKAGLVSSRTNLDSDDIRILNKAFACEQDPLAFDEIAGGKAWRSYGMNIGSGSENDVDRRDSIIDQSFIRSPSETVMFCELPMNNSELFSKSGNYTVTGKAFYNFITAKNQDKMHGKDNAPVVSAVFFDGSTASLAKPSSPNSPECNYFYFDKRHIK